MKVLIADKFEQVGIDGLHELGCEVEFEPSLTADALPAHLETSDPDVLIVRSTKVSEQALQAAGRLGLIIRAGSGYDTIDVGAASGLGIFVANCPGKNAIAVAELVMGLICACDRRIPQQTADLKAGIWKKKEYGKARGLYGRTLGVVGLGRIGKEIMTRAHAFGMNVVGWSRSLTPDLAEQMGIAYAPNAIEVARVSDAVTINVAATAETKDLVNDKFLAAMKPGAYLINTSRGSVVDEAALAKAIETKDIRAGLDVFCGEPAAGDNAFTNPIVQHDNVIGTHHVGASTDQSQVAVAGEVIRIMTAYVESGDVPNCVNRLAKSSATHVLSVRHRNRPGVLAHVFAQLAESNINVEEVENIIYHGAEATCARIHLDSPPNTAVIECIRTNCADVLSVGLSAV